ncbi:hypothetical protein TRFO_25050 [Tritrichomonas foetus]|uniref:DM10 domain-containing protein n=1 Tax=Tritrichomonas foetus TaxID=1144522 RepID=A0A1J4KB03_9EUKA|nr:hypothetical protein TRFO_25050 [Tritrichomonas foetus]|eukprot:OHT06870.1 hypothetical protein TRFO_25050 [Tritrichomonas foetus]
MRTTAVLPTEFPNYPGYTFYDPRKQDYRRGQYLKVTAGLMGARPPLRSTITKQLDEHSKTITFAEPPMVSMQFQQESSIEQPKEEPYEPVLRFYAYFREDITESQEEEQRVRYVRIHIYLVDNSIMIEEYRIRNSGMEQGVLLRRMRALNPNSIPFGGQYIASDFKVGINVEIYGIVYHIYSCDKFTENYFHENGLELGQFEEPPDDLYSIKRKLTERPIRVGHIDTDKTHLRQFLDFDGKVLRFYAIWDDRTNLFGEKRKFVVHYFLVDDTIEVVQVLPPNSGRDPVSRLLMKTKLTNPQTGQPYKDSDLRIGCHIDVNGRDFFLYDADPFTQQFLDQKYGPHDWTPINIEEALPFSNIKKEPPPYNGWGDEQDSLGYCYSLHPKPPRKDIVKLITKDGEVLRFSARFKNPAPQDRNRDFVVAFYMMDDTVAVFELPKRNSGFREGKFIQRSRVKNVRNNNNYFVASDFEVGKEVVINGYTFQLGVADEYAMSYMEADTIQFPQADLHEIIMKYKSDARALMKSRRTFEGNDPKLSGFVDKDLAERTLVRNYNMPMHEAVTIVRRWSNDFGFDYFSFVSALQ